MKKNLKTNATRILDRLKIEYELFTYDYSDGEITGVAVANKIGKPVESVFKTLVTYCGQQLFVFVIPVEKELDLKKAAKATNVKKLDMLPQKDLQKWTGYIRGGCSPIGMKKSYPTFIDETALQLKNIVISAGKIGLQVEIDPTELGVCVEASFCELTKVV